MKNMEECVHRTWMSLLSVKVNGSITPEGHKHGIVQIENKVPNF
jgi:hypothetical protein